MTTDPILWHGRPIEELSREELLELVRDLNPNQQSRALQSYLEGKFGRDINAPTIIR